VLVALAVHRKQPRDVEWGALAAVAGFAMGTVMILAGAPRM
jgi:hypothetical protein